VVCRVTAVSAQEHIEGTQKVFGTEAGVILKLQEESVTGVLWIGMIEPA